MKRFLSAIVLVLVTAPALAADVGVSVSIGQPGFYGTIEVSNYPRPRLVYAEPKVIYPARVGVIEPVYMRVPPGHARNWRKHCGAYNACGHRVYFVQDSWYNNVYVPHYREQHRHEGQGDDDQGDHKHKGKGHKGRD